MVLVAHTLFGTAEKRGSPAISCGRATLPHPKVAEMGDMVACSLIGTPSRDMQPSSFRFGLPAGAGQNPRMQSPLLGVSSRLSSSPPFDTVALPSPAAVQLVCVDEQVEKAELLRWRRPFGGGVPRRRSSSSAASSNQSCSSRLPPSKTLSRKRKI